GLAKQLVGPHGGLDGGHHDAETLEKLVDEGELNRREWMQGGEFDDPFDLPFENDRHDHQVDRFRFPQRRAYLHVVRRYVVHENPLPLARNLAHHALTDLVAVAEALAIAEGVGSIELELYF